MNYLTRILVVVVSAGVCAGGVILTARDTSPDHIFGLNSFADAGFVSSFEPASSDLQKFSFAQIEEIVRADAANRFPNMRVELGSVKAGHGTLMMNVVLFGPNDQAQAFVYSLAPNRSSWKIVSTRRLWFVPPNQITRGVRV